MKDKEMIEEMVKVIIKIQNDSMAINRDGYPITSPRDIAKELLKYYQPKLPKDSVVLTKDEQNKILKATEARINQLRKQLKEMYEQGKFDALADLEKDGKVVITREEYEKLKLIQSIKLDIKQINETLSLSPTDIERIENQTRKETAEKIYSFAVDFSDGSAEWDLFLHNFREKFGGGLSK